MLNIFWIALKLRNSKMGLITCLSLAVKNLTTFKYDGVAKTGNTAMLILVELA